MSSVASQLGGRLCVEPPKEGRRDNDEFRSLTYPLVQVNGVLAGHHVGDSRTLLLAGLNVGHI